jgi:hypothetical protein
MAFFGCLPYHMSKLALKYATSVGAMSSALVFSGCISTKIYAIKSDDTLKDFPTSHIVKYVVNEYGTIMAAMSCGFGITVYATIINPAAAIGLFGSTFGVTMYATTLPQTVVDRTKLLQPLHPPHPELR